MFISARKVSSISVVVARWTFKVLRCSNFANVISRERILEFPGNFSIFHFPFAWQISSGIPGILHLNVPCSFYTIFYKILAQTENFNTSLFYHLQVLRFCNMNKGVLNPQYLAKLKRICQQSQS